MMNKRKLIMESNKLYSYIDVIPGEIINGFKHFGALLFMMVNCFSFSMFKDN